MNGWTIAAGIIGFVLGMVAEAVTTRRYHHEAARTGNPCPACTFLIATGMDSREDAGRPKK